MQNYEFRSRLALVLGIPLVILGIYYCYEITRLRDTNKVLSEGLAPLQESAKSMAFSSATNADISRLLSEPPLSTDAKQSTSASFSIAAATYSNSSASLTNAVNTQTQAIAINNAAISGYAIGSAVSIGLGFVLIALSATKIEANPSTGTYGTQQLLNT